MPLLKIQTNKVVEPATAKTLIADASTTVADLLGKPERYVMVSLEHNPAMLFGGSDEPLAYMELKSIGLPESQTTEMSRSLCELLNKALDLPADRIYIEFASPPRHFWGFDGATF